jgi:hypothetical protein
MLRFDSTSYILLFPFGLGMLYLNDINCQKAFERDLLHKTE